MEQALIVSNALLWVAVLTLAAIVFALVRQIGVLYERVAPAGALMLAGGPKVGEAAPVLTLDDVFGRATSLGGDDPENRQTLLLFVSPTCPVCKTLLPVAKSLAAREPRASRDPGVRLVFASDGQQEDHVAFVRKHALDAYPYLVSTRLGLAHQVGKLPHAVLWDARGIVRAKGLVNSREHLESLFEAMDRGVASIQEYVSRVGGSR
jgi:methylamine dehydrogenase accessory protein MauD